MAAGIHSEWRILGEICYLPIVRNKLVRGFLESKCTDLLFVDSDVGFAAASLLRVLGYDADVVCGAPPLKQVNEAYPVREIPDRLPAPNGLVEVEHGPTGFMRIRRGVFGKIRAAGGVRHVVDYGPSGKRGEYDSYFDTAHEGVSWIGEDVEFCRRARAVGCKVWLDPNLTFTHTGAAHYIGNYREWKAKAGRARAS